MTICNLGCKDLTGRLGPASRKISSARVLPCEVSRFGAFQTARISGIPIRVDVVASRQLAPTCTDARTHVCSAVNCDTRHKPADSLPHMDTTPYLDVSLDHTTKGCVISLTSRLSRSNFVLPAFNARRTKRQPSRGRKTEREGLGTTGTQDEARIEHNGMTGNHPRGRRMIWEGRATMQVGESTNVRRVQRPGR